MFMYKVICTDINIKKLELYSISMYYNYDDRMGY